MTMNAITLFCGSKSGKNPAFEQMAMALGSWLAEENITLVYGGGNKGLMANTVLGLSKNHICLYYLMKFHLNLCAA